MVDEPEVRDDVWWGSVNIKLDPQSFLINRERAIDYLNTRERLYVVDGSPAGIRSTSSRSAS